MIVNQYDASIALWCAMLQQAVEDLNINLEMVPKSKKAAEAMAKESAKEWITSNSTDPLSFIWVCELLDLSHEKARKQIIGGNTVWKSTIK